MAEWLSDEELGDFKKAAKGTLCMTDSGDVWLPVLGDQAKEANRLRAVLQLIAERRRRCDRCGAVAEGTEERYVADCCDQPAWVSDDPAETAARALGLPTRNG